MLWSSTNLMTLLLAAKFWIFLSWNPSGKQPNSTKPTYFDEFFKRQHLSFLLNCLRWIFFNIQYFKKDYLNGSRLWKAFELTLEQLVKGKFIALCQGQVSLLASPRCRQRRRLRWSNNNVDDYISVWKWAACEWDLANMGGPSNLSLSSHRQDDEKYNAKKRQLRQYLPKLAHHLDLLSI